MKLDRALENAGYAVADEIRDGKWAHAKGIHDCPAVRCEEILAEMRRRCPGYTDDEYASALGQGFFDSR